MSQTHYSYTHYTYSKDTDRTGQWNMLNKSILHWTNAIEINVRWENLVNQVVKCFQLANKF